MADIYPPLFEAWWLQSNPDGDPAPNEASWLGCNPEIGKPVTRELVSQEFANWGPDVAERKPGRDLLSEVAVIFESPPCLGFSRPTSKR